MSKLLKPCQDYKSSIVEKILDWQADLGITISNPAELLISNIVHLEEMLKFYEDTLKNGKRF